MLACAALAMLLALHAGSKWILGPGWLSWLAAAALFVLFCFVLNQLIEVFGDE